MKHPQQKRVANQPTAIPRRSQAAQTNQTLGSGHGRSFRRKAVKRLVTSAPNSAFAPRSRDAPTSQGLVQNPWIPPSTKRWPPFVAHHNGPSEDNERISTHLGSHVMLARCDPQFPPVHPLRKRKPGDGSDLTVGGGRASREEKTPTSRPSSCNVVFSIARLHRRESAQARSCFRSAGLQTHAHSPSPR
jgi:hypothetical protein